MASIAELVVRLLADTGNFNASMDAAAAKVTASNDAMAASMATSMQSFRDFDNITKQSVQSADGLAQAQAALTAVQQTGAFTSAELAAKQALVDAAMAKVARETQAASGAMGALTSNSRTMYTVSAGISDLLTGQFSRSRREIAALSNETGVMASAFRFAVSPVGLLVGAVAAVGAAAIEAQRSFDKFENVIQLTNGTIGVTAGQLQTVAEKIGDTTKDYDDASIAVRELGASGRFTADQLQTAATAAVQFANLTGEKIGEVDKLMIEMATHPQKALAELVDKYHRITPAQADVIAGFLKQGDTAKATEALITDMAASVNGSVDDQAKHTSWLAKAWDDAAHSVAKYFRTFGESVDVETGGGDAAMKLRLLQDQINNQATPGERSAMAAYLQPQIEALQKIVDQENAAAAAAKRRADAYREMHPEKGSFAALKKEGFGGIDLTGNLNKQLQTLEAATGVTYDRMEETSDHFWQYVLHHAQAGSQQWIEAWNKVQDGQKRTDAEQLAESNRANKQREEAARRASTKLVELERHTQSEIKEEMRKAAEANAQEVRERIASAEQGTSAAVEAAQWEYDRTADKLRSMLQLHEITAEQEVEGKKRAEEKEYEDQLAALENDLALVREKPEAVAKVYAEIERLGQQHKFAQQKLDEEEASAFQKTWEDRLQPVSNAFDQMINGMMQGTQTFRQAMDNMLQNVAASFIKNSIDMTVQHIADSLARTDATAAAAASQVAITKAAAAQTKAVEAKTGQSQIMSAAATGAAKAYQAVVGIPFVGPILAPVAAAVAFAGIEAFSSDLASAAGGWERVPADGMLTELHRDEMVLPKSVADPMRNMARTGGNGGGTIIIQANDAASFQEMARRNRGALVGVMREAYRRGHFG